jgi:hypothetical protein
MDSTRPLWVQTLTNEHPLLKQKRFFPFDLCMLWHYILSSFRDAWILDLVSQLNTGHEDSRWLQYGMQLTRQLDYSPYMLRSRAKGIRIDSFSSSIYDPGAAASLH